MAVEARAAKRMPCEGDGKVQWSAGGGDGATLDLAGIDGGKGSGTRNEKERTGSKDGGEGAGDRGGEGEIERRKERENGVAPGKEEKGGRGSGRLGGF